jgi:hypothetical protein
VDSQKEKLLQLSCINTFKLWSGKRFWLLILLIELKWLPSHVKVRHDRHLGAAQLSVKGRRWCVFVKKSSQEHGEAPTSRTMGKLRLGINFVSWYGRDKKKETLKSYILNMEAEWDLAGNILQAEQIWQKNSRTTDEVLPRQCPCLRAFDLWSVCGRLADSTVSDRNRGCTRFYPGSAPHRIKTYILLVWSCIAGIYGAVTMVRRCNLTMVERDGMASLCVGSMRDQVSMRDCAMRVRSSRGRPWWLYICSQLRFTSSSRLLLQVKVLGLAGFVYPSSGLLPWQKPGR